VNRRSQAGVSETQAPLPAAADARFEAIVLVTDAIAPAADLESRLTALLDARVSVAIVTRAPRHEMWERLAMADGRHRTLLLADRRSPRLTAADGSGTHEVLAPPGAIDSATIDRAAELTVASLGALGLRARPVAASGSSLIAFDLFDDDDSAETVDELLFARGVARDDACGAVEAAAREAGILDVRIVVGHRQLELARGDDGDAFGAVLGELWRLGISAREVVVLVDGADRSWPHLLAGAADGATVLAVDTVDRAVPAGVGLVDGWGGAKRVLDDQLARRRAGELPALPADARWSVVLAGLDEEHERVHEALVTLADGRIGVSAPLFADGVTRRWMVAAGVYDGDGPDTHLLTGPVPAPLFLVPAEGTVVRRSLDLHSGVLRAEVGVGGAEIAVVRFASLARPGTVVVRVACPDALDADSLLLVAAEDPPHDEGTTADGSWMRVAASAGGIVAAAAGSESHAPGSRSKVLDRFVAYEVDRESLPDPAVALDRLHAATDAGFDRLFAEHREKWAQRWEDADIIIEGDDELQLATRYALFQLMASVGDGDGEEAAVGARGLTGTGYRGHVFWDADTFVLPFLAATHPASARAMLEYRIRRLEVARAAARALSRRGARFPWESARSGRDVTPLSGRDRSGRVIPIRTGQLEEHIVAEVAWAANCYLEWTGDDEFARGPGLSLFVETARYWASRVRVEPDGGAHIYGVIGPDEYHEPVDDNAFTNVIARWNLRRAAELVETLPGEGHDVEDRETDRWRELAAALVDGYDPDTAIYEQFAGFARLEPLIIEELAPRRPIAADLLLGPERVRAAQVLKQADVLLLHHLVPDDAVPGSLEPNLRFYEPRTAHGSSLSPAVYASLFARVRDFPRALALLRVASRIDLDDLTGSTAGGVHLATMGGLWQALAFGFLGLRPRAGRLDIDPRLPPQWAALDIHVRFHGNRVAVRAEHERLTVSADAPTDVTVAGTPFTVDATGLQLRQRGPGWEVVP